MKPNAKSKSASSAPKKVSASLAQALLRLEARYRTPDALAMDPLQVVLDHSPEDQELVAWVAAQLAYGRVAPMLAAIRRGLRPLGARPAEFLRTQSESEIRKRLNHSLKEWVWRFQTREDLIEWFLAWKRLDAEGGLEVQLQPRPGRDADTQLSNLVQRLRQELPATHGLRFFLPDPKEGAACKRWRLFLRWMVRSDWPDLGLWSNYPKSALVIPLDTHVARISRHLGLSARSTPDGRMAREITQALAALEPNDPLRFDFALAHLGILGDCPTRIDPVACGICLLKPYCREGKHIKTTS